MRLAKARVIGISNGPGLALIVWMLILCTPRMLWSDHELEGGVPWILSELPDSEFDALVEFYEATGGDGWVSRWPLIRSFRWNGLTVTEGHVTGILLRENGLTGRIPDSLASLTKLRSLCLCTISLIIGERNQLSGSIPENLGDLTELVSLNLNHNELSGVIPGSLGALENLERLNLSYNRLSGPIPGSLVDLSNLERLELRGNALNSMDPDLFRNLRNLRWLDIRENYLGAIVESEAWIQVRDELRSAGVLVYDLPQKQRQIVGGIGRLQGPVWVVRDGERTQLNADDAIYANDVIETESGSSITANLDDGSTVTVAGGSTLEVNEYEFDPDTNHGSAIYTLKEGVVHFLNGIMRSTDGKSPVRVKTRSVSTGVRGTEYAVEYHEAGGFGVTSVTVESGSVTVTDKTTGITQLVEAGQSETIASELGRPISIYYDSDHTFNLGGGWMWSELGYLYSGLYPYVYSMGIGDWIYILGDSEEAYYFWAFAEGFWGYTGAGFYPFFLILTGERAGEWVQAGQTWE